MPSSWTWQWRIIAYEHCPISSRAKQPSEAEEAPLAESDDSTAQLVIVRIDS